MQIRTVAVLGAGTMGHGIAQVAAQAGFDVTLYDVQRSLAEAAIERIDANLAGGVDRGKLTAEQRRAALARLRASSALEEAVDAADLVIEAVPEKLELKRQLFARVETLVPPACVLATNTSSLSIAEIAAALRAPERFLGMHFFNPVHLMRLLELVIHEGTAESALAVARSVGAAMGKTTIVVRDSPGFATSRLGVALGLEAMRMLEEGVASAQDIDTAMELGYRHPMGPLKLSDLVGLDVRLQIAEYLHRKLGRDLFEPPAILRRLVAEGRLGKKSGRGFYDWPED